MNIFYIVFLILFLVGGCQGTQPMPTEGRPMQVESETTNAPRGFIEYCKRNPELTECQPPSSPSR